MKPTKKSKIVALTKVRMREELKDQLARSALRNNRTQNGELVHRLEQSFAGERDSAILDLLISNDDFKRAIQRTMKARLAKDPNWSGVKHAERLLEGLSEEDEEPQSGEDK